jgi:hypothetical protein
MEEKSMETLREEYLSGAEPIRRRIEDLQGRLRHARGDERIQLQKRIASLTDDLWALTYGVKAIQKSIDGHTKI